MYIDDDDLYVEGTISRVVRPALQAAPKEPHVFRAIGLPLLPPPYDQPPHLGALFAWPNTDKLGQWDNGLSTEEYPFLAMTAPQHPVIHSHNEAIYWCRPHEFLGQRMLYQEQQGV